MSKRPIKIQSRTSEDFQRRMLELIEEHECTKAEFAKLVGVSETVITRASVFGILPSVRILIKIADAIDISLEYLLGLSSKNEYIPAVKPSTYHIRVQELAKERNVTFGMIANSLVITFPRTYFYQWQKNKTYPSIDYLIQIATYFSVSLDYLTGRSDYKN